MTDNEGMLKTKKDAEVALRHLDDWNVHPGDLARDAVARFITEVMEQLPDEPTEVANVSG